MWDNCISFIFADCKKFEEKETIEGVKVLSASKMSRTDEPNKSNAVEWFKEMGFKPLSNEGIPGMSSLLQSILKTCKHDHVDIGNVLEDDLEKRLEAGITKKKCNQRYVIYLLIW